MPAPAKMPDDYDGSTPLQSAKQERFAQACLSMNQSDAYRTAYDCARLSKKSVNIKSCRLRATVKVGARVAWLQAQVCDDTIMSVLERKQVLSELGRRDPSDYLQSGKDGSWITYGPESKNRRAVSGIESVTKSITSEKGTLSETSIITKIKVIEPTTAIDLLNKMDGLYAANEGGGHITIIQDLAMPTPGAELEAIKKWGKKK